MSSSSFFLRDEVKVGDIFKLNTFPGLQTMSRAWHFYPAASDDEETRHPGPHSGHKVLLRHCLTSGKWVLIIDGLPHMKGCEPIMNRKFEIPFSINSRDSSRCERSCVITATGKAGMSLGYSHCLVVQEKDIPELKRNINNLRCGDNPPEHVSIPDTRMYNDGVKDVTLFQIFIKPFQGGQIIAERRFSEFIALSRLIKGLKDKHSGILPILPRRVFSPWTDQQSAEFINERREALQLYLQSLLSDPRVCSYTEFLCFLGLDPITGNPLQEPLSASLLGSDDDEEGFQN